MTVPRGAAFVGGAVVAVVLAVLVVAAAGPVRWAAPIHLGIYGGQGTFPSLPPQVHPTLPTPTASPCAGASCPTPDPKALHLPGWLAFAAAVALLVLATRLRRRRSLAPEEEPDDGAEAPVGAAPPPEVSASAVDDAVAAAAAELEGDRDPRDAVIAAWLRLEAGAAAAGVARRPAQTPTEFTRAVLAGATGGREAEAVDDLLHLYHRARFGRRPLPPDAGEQAARALDRVAAALRRTRTPARSEPRGEEGRR